ncbi:hypothetical protein ACF1BU_29735 [Streptomyces sp. NPDC014724]|uniref:hypothetical protein n=1 Tax=unclassified Streptomyces TaxID=2593676 RepID=UPI0036F4FE0B
MDLTRATVTDLLARLGPGNGEDGLLIWAGTEHEDLYRWRADGHDPYRWPVVVRSFDGKDVPFGCRAAEFVCRILIDPHHPFTTARCFDTHWFMNHRDSA